MHANARDARVERLSADVHIDEPTGSFNSFYQAEYGRIVRLLYGQTGSWAVAEDIAQEALLAAHRRWQRVENLDRPDLWLRRVAMNRAISVHRRLVSEVSAFTRLRRLETQPAVAVPEDAEVWAEVQRLPRRQAAVVVLRFVEGLTYDEIGAVLGCSAETARTHFRRAKERLAASKELRDLKGADNHD